MKSLGGARQEVKESIETRERLTLRNKVKEEEHSEIYGGLTDSIGQRTYLHGPIDYSKTLKLRFRVGDLDVPERRKGYTSSREEEKEDGQMCPCGKAIDG